MRSVRAGASDRRIRFIGEVLLTALEEPEVMIKTILDAKTGLGRDPAGFGRIDSDHVFDLFLDPFRFSSGQVDLVQDRDDLMVVVDGLIDIC